MFARLLGVYTHVSQSHSDTTLQLRYARILIMSALDKIGEHMVLSFSTPLSNLLCNKAAWPDYCMPTARTSKARYSRSDWFGKLENLNPMILPSGKLSKAKVDAIAIDGHRLVAWAIHGPPADYQDVVMHSCNPDCKKCVNPKHLKWGSKADNRRR